MTCILKVASRMGCSRGYSECSTWEQMILIICDGLERRLT